MQDTAIFIGALAWGAVGAASHIYWWTRKYDYTTNELVTTILSTFLGPGSWFIGWSIHGNTWKDKVLIKKRKEDL